MTPALQRGIAAGVVLVAAMYLSWRSWRHWRAVSEARRSSSCGPNCGCG